MGLQKLVILGDLGDWNFYVIKCFPIDTNTLIIVRIQIFLNFSKDLILYCGPDSLY